MKISFLVTYYNQEQYVRQSLDSILSIDKPDDWEILVGDDGSNDGTVEIVNEYIKRFPDEIKLFVMPREESEEVDFVKRASANRLNLLEHCSGDCFCTLDGDDFYIDSSFVKEAISIFEKKSNISIVSFGYKYFKDGMLQGEELLPYQTDQQIETEDYINNRYLHAGACVYKIAWDKNRIDYLKNIGFFDDNDIVINSLSYGDMYYLNRPVYAYRQTGKSIYTSMKRLEQAVLNTLGYDVDKLLIDSSYTDALTNRYGSAILTMYVWRKRIKVKLGEAMYNRYLNTCKKIPDAISYKLLNYQNLENNEITEVNKVIQVLQKQSLMYTKIVLKYVINRIQSLFDRK